MTALPLGLLAAALLAGCGGGAKSNGIEKMSANDALTKVKAAVADVTSVHVVGQFSQSGQTMTVDVSIGDKKATGTIHVGGGTMDLRLVNGVTYFRGDSKVFASFGANSAQASLAAGRWIKDAGTSPGGPASSFASFLDRQKMFDELLTPQGSVSTGGTATINGHKALILIDNSADGGKLYVATTGAALPLRIQHTGTNAGRIDFTDYNATVTVQAPSGALDLSQLSGG